MQRPTPVPFAKLSTISMVEGGEKTHSTVIVRGIVKEWVGFGWIGDEPATPRDYLRYPEAKD